MSALSAVVGKHAKAVWKMRHKQTTVSNPGGITRRYANKVWMYTIASLCLRACQPSRSRENHDSSQKSFRFTRNRCLDHLLRVLPIGLSSCFPKQFAAAGREPNG